jgi:trk system potassium uptake protein TrkH
VQDRVLAQKAIGGDLVLVLYAVGWLLVILALAMLVPAAVDAARGEPDWQAFLGSAGITLFFGALLVFACQGPHREPQVRTAFLLTSLTWLAVALFGSLPFQIGEANLSFTDAMFETMSGITTTGSTVMVGLERTPPGLLLWRSLLQLLGGIGIVLISIIILPFLRIGGMQLFRTESSDRSAKLLPSMRALMGRILGVYLGLVGACTVALDIAGMDFFEAFNHACATLSTGGFSTRDASVGGFANPAAEWLITLFMIAGSLPMVRFVAVLQGRADLFFRDSQIRLFLAFVLIATAVLTGWLVTALDRPLLEALRLAMFNVVSVMTTTGFATTDYQLWGAPAIALFLALTIVGGCTGSTAGGIKTFRFEILWLSARLYLTGLFLPSRVARPRYESRPVDAEVINGVLSFVFFFMGAWGLFTVVLGALGLDLVTAISGSATALANVGPGLGPIIGPAGNFQPLSDSVKWTLTLAMLLGRLEFFTLLVLLHPAFWRR